MRNVRLFCGALAVVLQTAAPSAGQESISESISEPASRSISAPVSLPHNDSLAKNYVQLRIGGRFLAWPQPEQGALKLTWSLARESMAVEGAVNCGRMRGVGEIGSFERQELRRRAGLAFAYWQKAVAVDFEYVEDPAKALVIIGALETPQGIAFADVQHKPGPDMLRGEITRGFICLNASAKWKSGFDGDLKSYDIGFVLAHEIGHVLGLDHPSSTGQLMSWRYDERTRELQAGDIEGMASLYGRRRRMDAERR